MKRRMILNLVCFGCVIVGILADRPWEPFLAAQFIILAMDE